MKELKIEAVPENIEAVIDFVNQELESHDCGFPEEMSIDIAVDEIFANISYYAYGDKTGFAEVSVEITGSPPLARIVFADSGTPFNPLKMPEPDVTLSIEEREIGGMGIHIVRKSMDSVEYLYKDGKNILTIEKYLNR